MAEGTNPDPVLAQLAILTQLVESQNARLDNLNEATPEPLGRKPMSILQALETPVGVTIHP